MLDDLTGKIALVTGASRGIGRAVALALAQAGADVAVNYVGREAQARDTVKSVANLGRRAIPVRADVSLAAAVAGMVEVIEADLGQVDILVNNAGIVSHQPLAEITEEDWDRMLAVNLKSAFLLTQRVLPGMRARRWGRIINLSSVAAQTGGVTGPALRRLQGRTPGPDAFLRPPPGQRGHHGERHRPGPHRDRHGGGPQGRPGTHPRRPLRRPG